VRATLAMLCLLLGACSPPLSGTFVDVEDASRFYTFSAWTRSWTSYYDETGSYSVDGNRIVIDTGGGIAGTLVSPGELRLEDVPAWRTDKTFNTYRRKPDP
jgi:hypothetical protein